MSSKLCPGRSGGLEHSGAVLLGKSWPGCVEEKAETGSRLQAEFLSCGSTHAAGRTEQRACTQACTQTERSLSGACLSQLSLSFPGNQEGRTGPATIPADGDFGICSCQAKRQEKAGKDCWSQPSHWQGLGQLGTALQEQGPKEAGEV